MKTNHKERKQKEGVLFQRDLQPQRMNLTEGDVVYVYKPAPLGEREDGREKRVPVRILKLYRNHALCKIGTLTLILHTEDFQMITWHEELTFDFSDPVSNEVFTENCIFFDIETTGFSPARTDLYLIGCATRRGSLLCIDQFFSENAADQKNVLSAFLELLSGYDTILTFNGIGFDIPYLKAKCKTLHLSDPFDAHSYIDLYKEVSRFKFLFALTSYKQKSIELFLGIDRIDAYSGGELIEVYKEYVRHPAKDSLALLKQHNYEDVLYMPKLLPVLSYPKLWEQAFSLQ